MVKLLWSYGVLPEGVAVGRAAEIQHTGLILGLGLPCIMCAIAVSARLFDVLLERAHRD